MSIEFEPIHVRPMTETPNSVFKYIYNDGSIGVDFLSCDFSKIRQNAVGWIPAKFTPKPPHPKEGEWWMCDLESHHIRKQVLFFESGHFRHGEGSDHYYSNAIPLYKMERAKE